MNFYWLLCAGRHVVSLDEDGEQKGVTFVPLEPEVKWQRETIQCRERGSVGCK